LIALVQSTNASDIRTVLPAKIIMAVKINYPFAKESKKVNTIDEYLK
jgi:hypothetical protein